jgi:hypothetical protein
MKGAGFKLILVGFSSLFVIVGVTVFGFGVCQYMRAQDSSNWPSAMGKVIYSDVERRSDEDGTTYSAEVEYEFTVADQLLSGNLIKFGEVNTSNSSHARRIVNRYPVGSEVRVFYDPNDPYLSVLEPGVHASTYFVPGFGLVFAAFGSGFMLFGLASNFENVRFSTRTRARFHS